jgi:hypothetical protein
MADDPVYHRDPYSYGSGDVEKDARKARHHKDSMQRYTSVNHDEDQDHFLNPEDGKLGLLKVQLAPGFTQVGTYTKTWSVPPEANPFKRGWRAYRNAPRGVIRWTFGDTMRPRKSKAKSENFSTLKRLLTFPRQAMTVRYTTSTLLLALLC